MTAPKLLVHQLRLEQRAFWRNPETAFFTFALPVGLLLIFGFTSAHDRLPGRPDVRGLTFLVPGILAFGIIIAAYGTLAATIATLRAEGVLKRIRATPLAPGMYLAGQLASVLVTSLVVAATTVVLGRLAFDIAPRGGSLPGLAGVLALGILCFSSLGLAVSALIPRADAAGAITNGTYLPLALVSGNVLVRADTAFVARPRGERLSDQGPHRRSARRVRPRVAWPVARKCPRARGLEHDRDRAGPSVLPLGTHPMNGHMWTRSLLHSLNSRPSSWDSWLISMSRAGNDRRAARAGRWPTSSSTSRRPTRWRSAARPDVSWKPSMN